MPEQKVYFDENGDGHITAYANDDGRLFINVWNGNDNDVGAYLTLDVVDVESLIEELKLQLTIMKVDNGKA